MFFFLWFGMGKCHNYFEFSSKLKSSAPYCIQGYIGRMPTIPGSHGHPSVELNKNTMFVVFRFPDLIVSQWNISEMVVIADQFCQKRYDLFHQVDIYILIHSNNFRSMLIFYYVNIIIFLLKSLLMQQELYHLIFLQNKK